METYGLAYQQLAYPVRPLRPKRSAPSSVDLDGAADQAISASGGGARKTVTGLIAANDFIGDLYGVIGGRGRLVVSLGEIRHRTASREATPSGALRNNCRRLR